MQIRLQTLEHQQRALKSITHVFSGVDLDYSVANESNPEFDPLDPNLRHNINELQVGAFGDIQSSIPSGWRTRVDDGVLGIDVKMETGTGKTLVYTQMMYELNQLYGFMKFIILVPSTPIKEGAKSFIQSDYAKQYFNDTYSGRILLNLDVLDPQKARKGRKMFPNAIFNFVSGSRLSKGHISALLMTDGMLQSKKTMETNYDQMVLGSASVPYDALAATKPIVIIDEPHRFRRENKAYQVILEKLQPQAIVRFGATFPSLEKEKRKDYNNLIFNLGAIDAFNDQLVKGVAIQFPQDESDKGVRLKLTNLLPTKPKTASFQDIDTKKSFTIEVGESLGSIDGDFAGIDVVGAGKTSNPAIKSGVTLSNDQILAKGDILSSKVYSDTYQGLMMARALDNHFEIEWENFRRGVKVKTLSLFFIDSIESYRGENNDGHLRRRFEQLLSAKLKEKIEQFKNNNSLVVKDYVEYLRASLDDVSATNGGYFSADNSTADEAIQAEVDQILRDKQSLLSFKNEDGSLNTRRFIFSKWTLREGWDNPNVFQIVKLRSSGSEISKLQEVGRGLRLPVDVNGTRLSGEQFYLTYLIDFTEEEFADQLVKEVNSDIDAQITSVEGLLEKIALKRGIDPDDLFMELLHAGYIDRHQKIKPEKQDEFFEQYPEFTGKRLDSDKIVREKKTVGIRQQKFFELKDLWEKINAKYFLKLDDLSSEEVDACIASILDEGVYSAQVGRFQEEEFFINDKGELESRRSTRSTFDTTEVISYGEWLQLAYKQTYLPVEKIHKGLVAANRKKKLPKDFFNKATLGRFVTSFIVWMQKEMINRFSYSQVEGICGATALTDESGWPLEKIIQGNLGVHRKDNEKVPEKFLYDAFIYDSPKEGQTIRDSGLEEVVVYGKIPRRSIQVPLYFGGTTSPDFMYVLKGEDGKMSLNFIIETKDVERETDLRGSEQLRIAAAQRFFESIDDGSINVSFRAQLKSDDIVSMIKEIRG
ncbi:type III restriction-modification system endonuclease [Corynebacterium callunae]|uniref:type III restriction-modification system endonuclease n=1 Tax=Corynebacterium callunae TaxID=1721 RepID=UPI001FFEE70A|nr:type III restriction-modification system endonuclease [Corynebacterium callunae]MCK2200569.1 type III restriction-modification system endonuclease [Corynebacterium callunae]